jgi:soluble lytic murein transglycosylase
MRAVVKLLCLGSSLAIGLSTAAADPPTPAPLSLSAESRDRFVAALAAFRAADWPTAATDFGDRAWASTSLASYALLFQAQSLLSTGDAVGARAAAQQAVGDSADGRLAPSALVQAGAVLSSAGDGASAASVFRHFLAHHGDHPDAPRVRLELAETLLAGGLGSEAARTFRALWVMAPAAPEAESAAQQLRILAARGLAGPATLQERVERAERLLAAGRPEPARTEAEGILSDGPSTEIRSRALKVVFDASRRAGRYDQAVATVNRALASLPAERPRWLLELVRLERRRNPEQAVATVDKLARDYPTSPESADALLIKGGLLEEAAKTSGAQHAYRALLAAHADRGEAAAALWRLGWLAWFQGSYAEAAASWARVLTIRGGHAYREASLYWLGRAEEQRGERATAARRFAQLQDDAPRSYYGILAGQRHGDASGASRAAPASVPLPEDPSGRLRTDPDYARVDALRAVGLGDFADEEMAEMVRRGFSDRGLLYALSAAYVQESRYHLALRILRRHFQSIARAGGAMTPRAFWEMYYPIGWRSELTEAADRAAIDPLLVAAVVREESSFYPRARSRVGARGLMQLMPDTARSLAQTRRLPFDAAGALDDPAANLDLGVGYLAKLLREFGDARLAAAAYNAGPTRVRDWWGARRSDDLEVWVEQIPFDETRAFVKRVVLSWDEYRRLYGAPVAGEPVASDDGSARP